ncbi:UDP-N-acetylmuramate dehydrogenase [Patescibacteria group bacterium]
MTDDAIKKAIPDMEFNKPLKDYTTFRIGGPAKYFIEVKEVSRFVEIMTFVREHKLRFFILAGGSNVLFLEEGFPGLVIKNSTGEIKRQGNNLIVDSGYDLHGVVRYACKEGLAGLEKLAWIPGSIGGSVYGNAGAYGSSIGDLVRSVEVFDLQDGQLKEFSASHCEFSYRNSAFKSRNYVILRVILEFKQGDTDVMFSKCEDINQERKAKNPQLPSAGCFFKNIPIADVKNNKEVQGYLEGLPGDKIPAGLLIDKLGLKGKTIGGAMISKKHANFIVNNGNATADNVLKLADLVKTKVRDTFGIQMELEVLIVG